MATPLRIVPQKQILSPGLIIYSLSISAWTARGKDDEMTTAAKEAKDIKQSENVGNFIKKRLDCKELTDLISFQGKVRTEFYTRTVPWGEVKNVRAGKIDNHMKLMQWIGDQQAALEPLKDALRDKYNERVEEERFKLQGAFDEEDYPPVDEVISRYRISVRPRPLTNVNDIRVMTEIPADERKRLEDMVIAEKEESIKESMNYSLGLLLPKVVNLAKQLKDYSDGKTKRLFDSLVENVIEMADKAQDLNLCDAPEVSALADEAKEIVRNLTSDDLKVNAPERERVRKEAEDLAARMTTLFGGK